MTTNNASKKILAKFVAVVAVIAIVLCVAPVSGLSDILVNASAEAPVYDSSLGSYTTTTDSNGNTVLTAVPYENAGFRGWFLKDGTEVSYNAAYTLPSGASASDYVPVFYNFNLVKKGGFEEYTNNKSLKTGVPEDEIWEGITDGEALGTGSDWTSLTVTNNRARTGSNSLRIGANCNTAYKDFYNLDPYTQYTVKFYFNLDPNETADQTSKGYATTRYLGMASVIGENMETTYRGNTEETAEYLACKKFDTTTGASSSTNDWKEVSITFFTEESTSARLVLFYRCYYEDGKKTPCDNSFLYLDDVSLVKDVMATPTYFNENFATTVKSWKESDEGASVQRLSAELEGGRLKVTPILTYGSMHSPAIQLKKGAKYNISFDMDWSQVTDRYFPSVVDNKLVTDESLITEDNPNGYVWHVHDATTGALGENWMNFTLSTTKGATSPYYATTADKADTNVVWTITDANGVAFNSTFGKGATTTGFGRYSSLKDLDSTQTLKVNLSFTAHKTATTYFTARLNGLGTYYLDNFVITEDASTIDYAAIAENAVKSMGTAIRTVGKQGMRYKTQLDKNLLTFNYGFRLTEYGTAAIKTEYLGDNELVLDGMYDYGENTYGVKVGKAYSFNEKTDLVYAEDQDTIDFTGVLMNIPQKNWNSDYTARAYVKYVDTNGNESTVYVDPSDIAVYPISKAAYSARDEDGEFTESDDVREYLYENIISKYTDKVVKISNNSTPISSNFQGIRSTIYHATTFFPDSHGRTYTEAQAAVEMDRLVDTKVDNVRTRFASQWMWTSSGWNWESAKMTAYYKWAKMLQDRDISITLQAGWHLHDFMYYYDKWVATDKINYKEASAQGHSSIPEVNHMHGYTDANVKTEDLYGEDSRAAEITAAGKAVGLSLTDEEYAHYSVVAARYAEWVKQGLNAFKAHGVYNVEYVLPFTETGYAFTNPNTGEADPIYSYDEWMLMVISLNDLLEQNNMRSDYKFIGPAQSIYAYQNRLSFIEYMYSLPGLQPGADYEDLLDINAMHQYTSPHTRQGYPATVYGPYGSYALAEDNFTYYDDVLKTTGVRDMEFWCDEYFAHASDARWWHNVGMQMTQFAAGLTAGMNNGVNRFLTWQMFDCLWDSTATHGAAIHDNSGEFSGGVHAVGTCPSLVHVDGKTCPKGESCPCTKNYNISSYVPRTTYYGINLIGRFMNNNNADVFATQVIDEATEDNGGVYVSAIKNDDGKTVIMVVNTMPVTSSVDVELEKSDMISLTRYTYDPNEIVPTAEATPIPADKSITLNGKTNFYDVIPAQSFVIYVESGTLIGDDVDMPLEDMLD